VTQAEITALRNGVRHYLSPEVLAALARRMGL
jgi:hypothetical protein